VAYSGVAISAYRLSEVSGVSINAYNTIHRQLVRDSFRTGDLVLICGQTLCAILTNFEIFFPCLTPRFMSCSNSILGEGTSPPPQNWVLTVALGI
jgi:hypothetical protein